MSLLLNQITNTHESKWQVQVKKNPHKGNEEQDDIVMAWACIQECVCLGVCDKETVYVLGGSKKTLNVNFCFLFTKTAVYATRDQMSRIDNVCPYLNG